MSLFYECSDKKELKFSSPMFVDTIILDGQIVMDTFLMGASYNIACYKETLLLVAYTGEENEILHFFDKYTGRHIKSILPKGRGSGEVIAVPKIDIDQTTGYAFFYDYVTEKLCYFQIDSVINRPDPKGCIYSSDYPIYMSRILKGNDCFIAIDGNKEANGKFPRLSLIHNDSVIHKYYDYPSVKIGTSNWIRANYLYADYCFSPNKTKIACTCFYGAMLEIFDITQEQIKLDTVIGFLPPVYNIDKNCSLVIEPGETVFGFADLNSTRNYIYTIYCGDKDHNKRNNIAVFNWKGDCVRLYKTAFFLERICIDQDAQKLYATARSADYEKIIVKFDLNEN